VFSSRYMVRDYLVLASAQRGLVTREQLREAGFSQAQVEKRVQQGILRPMFGRVYRCTGASVNWMQAVMAACLWVGPDGAASHETAATLLRLDGFLPGPVHVATPRNLKAPKGADLRVHSKWELRRSDIVRVEGVPAACVERTLLDLFSSCPERAEKALDAG
jgi:predicted transcriptional regulator of viral defense system